MFLVSWLICSSLLGNMFCSFPSKCTHVVVCDGGGGGRILLQRPRYAEADGAEGGALQGLHGRVQAGVAEVDIVDLKVKDIFIS